MISHASSHPLRQRIDEAYGNAGGSITRWLLTGEARALYEEGLELLLSFEVGHEENQGLLTESINFLNSSVSDRFTPIKPDI